MSTSGHVHPRFARVAEAFDANFDEGLELGAGFAAFVDGERVVDLIGGFADRERTRAWTADTLTPVFSTTKALAAVMVARLVEAGRLDYATPLADLWPAFAAEGKGAVTVEMALSHQAGLPGFPDPMAPELWFEWDAICAKLAAMAPMWPPGSASGYHPVTFGYLAGEIFRRVDGRTLGRALREDVAAPLGLDLWIGLPDAEHGRVAALERPKTLPRFGEINAATRAAFLTSWASPGGRGSGAWRRAEIPSANGHATALALAQLMDRLSRGGDGVLGSPAAVAELARERIAGQDLVLPSFTSWGAGVMRNAGSWNYGPGAATFGHSGWGGSRAFAEPERRIGVAYVMNKQSSDLLGDPRARRLIEAVYASL